MKKKLTYRDQLLELSRIYNVREIQEYIKSKKNLTTGQFFIWSIFLTITRSIVIICGVFILILLFTGIHQLFAKKTKRKGSAGW